MSKQRIMIAVGACLLLLTGCGSTALPENIDKTTISVDAEGKVTAYLVGNFEKEYYNVSELMEMAVEDAAAYNTEAKTGESVPVAVESVEMLENGTDVRITYQYDSAESYADYMQGVLFYGTVAEAYKAGYDLQTAPLNSVKDGTSATADFIKNEASEKHVLITDQIAEIYCPYAVTYISADAFYNENGSVTNNQSDDVIYILLKK